MGLIHVIRTGTRRGVYAISLACVATLVVAMRADAYALIDFDSAEQQTVGRRRDATINVLGARAMARWMVGWAMTYYALLFNQSCTAIECFEIYVQPEHADVIRNGDKDEPRQTGAEHAKIKPTRAQPHPSDARRSHTPTERHKVRPERG